jgi:glycosyltransferase involved in cell wall biosynthesis
MAKIGIDARCLMEGRKTGVEEYTLNFLKHLFEIDKKNKYVLFLNSFGLPLTKFKVFANLLSKKESSFFGNLVRDKSSVDFGWLQKFTHVSVKRFNYPNKLLNFLFWYLDWPQIDKMLGGVDFLFMPNIIFGATNGNTKLVTTFHDLSFVRYPETFSWKRRFWHTFVNSKKIAQKSKKIITVSTSTKNDLCSIFGIDQNKISIIPSGISEKFRIIDRNDGKLLQVKQKYKLPYKFILYLGTIEPRKNIIGIIRAYNQLQKFASHEKMENIANYKLVIAGSSGWLSEKIFAEIKKSKNKENIQVVDFIEDEDKEYVFNLASLFVYPSFFEGFGFPPLEAMSCGVPVIVSNSSSLPEVVGNGGIMIDPNKPDEIFEAMKEILTTPELKKKLIEKGLEQAKKFDWNKSAREFLKIIS